MIRVGYYAKTDSASLSLQKKMLNITDIFTSLSTLPQPKWSLGQLHALTALAPLICGFGIS